MVSHGSSRTGELDIPNLAPLRDTVVLRPDIASLAREANSGSVKNAAACSVAVFSELETSFLGLTGEASAGQAVFPSPH